jgi:hypothetical protein
MESAGIGRWKTGGFGDVEEAEVYAGGDVGEEREARVHDRWRAYSKAATAASKLG